VVCPVDDMQQLDRASVPAAERQRPVTAGLAICDAIEQLASLLSLVAPETRAGRRPRATVSVA
jgi:hypothetical protein